MFLARSRALEKIPEEARLYAVVRGHVLTPYCPKGGWGETRLMAVIFGESPLSSTSLARAPEQKTLQALAEIGRAHETACVFEKLF